MPSSGSDAPPRRRHPRHDSPRESRRKEYRDKREDRQRHRSRSRDHDRNRDRRRRSKSPDDTHRRSRDRPRRSHSPRRGKSSSPPPEPYRRKGPLPSQNAAFKSTNDDGTSSPVPEKQKPNFRPSGLLAAATNTITTSAGAVVLKYHEPAEARKPPSSKHWRLYIFKGDEILDTLDLYTQSCWLFGREVSVCDYALEHPSCSKQHAVIQFRYIEKRNEFGDKIGKVKPYIIDLESANGTKVNDEPVPEGRYVELRDKDIVTFGHSTREYVVQLPPG